MKKTMLGFAACALILSSCSQNEELVDNSKLNQEEIKFAPYVNKTKASVVDKNAMKHTDYPGFEVFAYLGDDSYTIFMSDLNVKWKKATESATSESWSHAGKYYWSEDYPISFFALAPDNTPMISLNATNNPICTLSIADDVASQIDILAASALKRTKPTSSNGQVDFLFKHTLSRIGFNAKVKDGDNLKFKINEVSYSYARRISKQGVLSFSDPAEADIVDNVITIANSEVFHNNLNNPYAMTLPTSPLIIEGTTAKPIHGLSSYLMILPQNLSTRTFVTLTIKYQIAVADDAFESEKEATVVIPGMNYQMGKAYTHNLIFSGSGSGMLQVTFGVTDVEIWRDDTTQPTDTNVPNPAPSN